ncbi:MAG TPA: hypothetical protein VF098_07880 [Sphingomicrobium sp.]
MKQPLLFILSTVLTSCATPQPQQPPAYHAVGTEPFWSLTIDQRTLTFALAGSQPVREPKPRVIVGIAGEIYRAPRIDVNIVHGSCSDGMSDRTFPDKVQVRVDDHYFNGCGGL